MEGHLWPRLTGKPGSHHIARVPGWAGTATHMSFVGRVCHQTGQCARSSSNSSHTCPAGAAVWRFPLAGWCVSPTVAAGVASCRNTDSTPTTPRSPEPHPHLTQLGCPDQAVRSPVVGLNSFSPGSAPPLTDCSRPLQPPALLHVGACLPGSSRLNPNSVGPSSQAGWHTHSPPGSVRGRTRGPWHCSSTFTAARDGPQPPCSRWEQLRNQRSGTR